MAISCTAMIRIELIKIVSKKKKYLFSELDRMIVDIILILNLLAYQSMHYSNSVNLSVWTYMCL